MPELSLPDVTLAYEQVGDGPDWCGSATEICAGRIGTSVGYGRAVAEEAANGHFHLLEGLGHASLLGHKPEPVNDLIL